MAPVPPAPRASAHAVQLGWLLRPSPMGAPGNVGWGLVALAWTPPALVVKAKMQAIAYETQEKEHL